MVVVVLEEQEEQEQDEEGPLRAGIPGSKETL